MFSILVFAYTLKEPLPSELLFSRLQGSYAQFLKVNRNRTSQLIYSQKMNFLEKANGTWKQVHNDMLRRSLAFSYNFKYKKIYLVDVLSSYQDSNDAEWGFHTRARIITINLNGKILSTKDILIKNSEAYYLGSDDSGNACVIRPTNQTNQYDILNSNSKEFKMQVQKSELPSSFKILASKFRLNLKQDQAIDSNINSLPLSAEWVNINLPTPTDGVGSSNSYSISHNTFLAYDGKTITAKQNSRVLSTSNHNTNLLYFVHCISKDYCVGTSISQKNSSSQGVYIPKPQYLKYYVFPQPPFLETEINIINLKTGHSDLISDGLYAIAIGSTT